jgi:hypothetical protein
MQVNMSLTQDILISRKKIRLFSMEDSHTITWYKT